VLLFLWLLPAVTGAILWFIPSTVFFYLSAAIWLVLCSTVAIAYRSLMGGMANLGQFRDALSILLQQQIYPNEVGRVVTMADFGIDGRPSLKIVSANLTTRRLHLFSKERTPETPAADAVAASICLPVIFEPWSIGREFHVDGGLVSNLPAWPFDEERELDPAALTVAIEIEDQELKSSKKPFAWLPAAVRTTLSGSAELNVRISGPAVQLALPTRLDLLDFDVDIATVCKEVDEVAAATALRLDKRLFRLPEIYRNACLVAQAVATDALGIAPNGKLDEPRVRVAVGRLERNYSRSLRLSYSAGFDDDADESMLIPLDGSFAGAAWADRQSILEVAPFEVTKDLPGPANRMRRKSRPANLAWVMCIPILDEVTGQSRLLVQLDGNWNLPQDSETEAALSSVEEAVKDFFRLVLHELRDLEEANGL
jgi:NTE family protein